MDADDFAPLYERLRHPLYLYAAARVSHQGALDVVHDTFEVVWAKRAQAPADPDQRVAWCFGIARMKLLQEAQRVRRKHHDNRFAADFFGAPLAASDDVAQLAIDADVGRTVWQALSADERRLVNTIVVLDVDGATAARVLGISHAAFRKRVSRLRKRIASLREWQDAKRDVEGRAGR